MRQATCPRIPVKASTGTPATPETLAREAFSILDARGITVSRSKISRIARDYLRHAVGSTATFESWLLSALHVDFARVIAYADPTGETAVRHVLRGTP